MFRERGMRERGKERGKGKKKRKNNQTAINSVLCNMAGY